MLVFLAPACKKKKQDNRVKVVFLIYENIDLIVKNYSFLQYNVTEFVAFGVLTNLFQFDTKIQMKKMDGWMDIDDPF